MNYEISFGFKNISIAKTNKNIYNYNIMCWWDGWNSNEYIVRNDSYILIRHQMENILTLCRAIKELNI